jgi:flagellin-like hook-associated protein FlgL
LGIVSLNTNVASLNTQRRLAQTTTGLRQSYERLSSGLRINKASDDAAGLAIAQSLQTDSRLFSQGVRNVNDGISLLNIAQGAVDELSKVVVRIQELAEQSANGTLTSVQRNSLDQEAKSLRAEYNRVAATTAFNGLNLLESPLSNLSLQVGVTGSDSLNLSVGTQMARDIGDGTFRAGSTVFNAAAGNVRGLEVADINNDGKLDVVSTTSGGQIYSMLGNGDGTFRSARSYQHGRNSQALILADFNNDGMADVVVNDISGGLAGRIFLGNGDGSFRAPVSWSQAINPTAINTAMTSGDFNEDGYLDLVVTGSSSDSFQLTLGNGDGTFRAAISMISYTGLGVGSIVRSADMNGDGKEDLQVGIVGSTMVFLLGNGDGTFNFSQRIASAYSGYGDFVDVNNDGVLDFAGAAGAGSIFSYAFLGNGDGTFKISALNNTGVSTASFMRFTDLNGDGFQDMIFSDASTNIYMMTGNGDGSFNAATSFSSPAQVNLAVGDFNGDGVTDLATASSGPAAGYVLLANSQKSGTLEFINLKTQATALSALDTLSVASRRLNQEVGNIGAGLSRLSTASNLLFSQQENFERAASQIRDVDVAEESSRLLRQQILQQAASSILTQANQIPQLALKLLQG